MFYFLSYLFHFLFYSILFIIFIYSILYFYSILYIFYVLICYIFTPRLGILSSYWLLLHSLVEKLHEIWMHIGLSRLRVWRRTRESVGWPQPLFKVSSTLSHFCSWSRPLIFCLSVHPRNLPPRKLRAAMPVGGTCENFAVLGWERNTLFAAVPIASPIACCCCTEVVTGTVIPIHHILQNYWWMAFKKRYCVDIVAVKTGMAGKWGRNWWQDTDTDRGNR